MTKKIAKCGKKIAWKDLQLCSLLYDDSTFEKVKQKLHP